MAINTGTRRGARRRIWFGVVRGLKAGFGICSIAWAVFSVDVNLGGAPFAGAAEAVLRGEIFNSQKLGELRRQLDFNSAERLRPAALDDLAVIRLRLLEVKLNEGMSRSESSDFADLEAALNAALSNDPNNSFLWFAEYWLSRTRHDDSGRGTEALRMSYITGPNEGWIAQRRNPVALEDFSALPPDLAEQVLSEFVRLVKSRLYADATNILAGPGWPLREKLMSRLAPLDEVDRRAMAGELSHREIEGISVPGIPDERRSRPF